MNIIAFGWGFRGWCTHASSRFIVRIKSVMIDTCVLERIFVRFQSCSVWWYSLSSAKSTGRPSTIIPVWAVTAKEMFQRQHRECIWASYAQGDQNWHNSIPSAISGWQTPTLTLASWNHLLELNLQLAPFPEGLRGNHDSQHGDQEQWILITPNINEHDQEHFTCK